MTEPTLTRAPQDFSHIIQTGKDGWLDGIVTARAHVVELIERAVKSGNPIVLHVHGGLVGKDSAYDMVNSLQPKYLSDGFFPIFIVWRTALADVMKNAGELVRHPLFRRLLIRLLKHFVSHYGDRLTGKALGLGEEPDDSEIEKELERCNKDLVPYEDVHPRPDDEVMSEREKRDLIDSVKGDAELRSEWKLQVEGSPNASPTVPSIDEAVREEALSDDKNSGGKSLSAGTVLALHSVKIAARVVKRFFRHRDHGLHATLVEEILRELYFDLVGSTVWQVMKQESADTFKASGSGKDRGGSLLMRLLEEACKERKDNGRPLPKISLVGHSAGSIYAANLLMHLGGQRRSTSSPWSSLQFEKVVYLAPAISCKALLPVLQLHSTEPLFKEFRMYSLTDERERGYYEVPILYPGSLLYIISGLLESQDDGGTADMPIVGMQRYARTTKAFTDPEVVQVWSFLNEDSSRLVWSGEDRGLGLRCDSLRHGDFFRTPNTIESFLHFLK